MIIKQLSIFLENKTGRVCDIAAILGENTINIRALSLADTSDFGIMRLIVDKPDDALKKLKENGFSVAITSVAAIEIPDVPGGLASVMKTIDDGGFNIEYMYAFVEKSHDNAILIMRFDDVENVVGKLREKGVKVLKEKEVLSL